MSNGLKPVAQFDLKVSDVTHAKVKKPLSYSKMAFTFLKNAYTPDGMRSISLIELRQLINTYRNASSGKYADRCVLKGLYENGFNGADCVKNSPYLFFDIDVKDNEKKKENTHLFDPETNQKIFNELKKVAVIVWRSNSGNGIAGVLYVPGLANYLNDKKELHLKAGEAITAKLNEYIHKLTGIKEIEFDQAQSKFRQVRFLAEQKQTRELNPYPLEFHFKVNKERREIAPNVPKYRPTNHVTPYGTIYNQFNADNDILNVAKDCGFNIVSTARGKIRLKHPNSTSTTSGEIDTGGNVYFNYSTSIAGHNEAFTPAKLLCAFGRFSRDWYVFRKYLNELGYKEKTKQKDEIKQISAKLKKKLQKTENKDEAGKLIFSYCYDLQTITPEKKKDFIKRTCPRPELKHFFIAYLNLPDYVIKPDRILPIKNYVAEVLPDVLNYADKHKKTILWAETGTGKTTAFIRDFLKHRPDGRILILEPLTVIIRQNQSEYGEKAICLTGESAPGEFEEAQYENFVFATYEQGVKLLHETSFDYVVIDEIHEFITANSYKRSVIADVAEALGQNTVIGLTGTPSNIFKNIGYQILEVKKEVQNTPKIEVRYLNNRPYDIALSHLRNVKGKTLLRLNDRKGIDILKDQLTATNLFKENEILVLYSTEAVKSGDHYKKLAYDRKFDEKIKLVLTTSLIDEGLSINQADFSDVVFLENGYHPRPEPIKQFFARFRNIDPKRKNYLYLRKTKDQSPGRFRPDWNYSATLKTLTQELNKTGEDELYSSYNTVFDNDNFFNENRSINTYFLAYSVTDNLFRSLNAKQFIDYLENNYNLKISVNENFAPDLIKSVFERESRKELKKRIAKLWITAESEIKQVLALHTLDSAIRNKLTVKQIAVSPEIEIFVLFRIKEFEKLYKRFGKLERLGNENPNEVLTKKDNKGVLTLNSGKHYKQAVTLLKLERAIFDPQNPKDRKAGERFIKFADWCKNQKEFTHNRAFRKLKKLGVFNNKAYTEDMLFSVLEWFEIDARRIDHNRVIKCTEKGRVIKNPDK